VPFSPLSDERLPEDLHGLYLGGGYPELYAAGFSASQRWNSCAGICSPAANSIESRCAVNVA